MAHFAEVIGGVVQRVIVVADEDITDSDGDEQESSGIEWCHTLTDTNPDVSEWVQCSHSESFRYHHASAGSLWDGTGFHAPEPFPSWTLDADYCWQPPVPEPEMEEGKHYAWDEVGQRWVDVVANPPPLQPDPASWD